MQWRQLENYFIFSLESSDLEEKRIGIADYWFLRPNKLCDDSVQYVGEGSEWTEEGVKWVKGCPAMPSEGQGIGLRAQTVVHT